MHNKPYSLLRLRYIRVEPAKTSLGHASGRCIGKWNNEDKSMKERIKKEREGVNREENFSLLFLLWYGYSNGRK